MACSTSESRDSRGIGQLYAPCPDANGARRTPNPCLRVRKWASRTVPSDATRANSLGVKASVPTGPPAKRAACPSGMRIFRSQRLSSLQRVSWSVVRSRSGNLTVALRFVCSARSAGAPSARRKICASGAPDGAGSSDGRKHAVATASVLDESCESSASCYAIWLASRICLGMALSFQMIPSFSIKRRA